MEEKQTRAARAKRDETEDSDSSREVVKTPQRPAFRRARAAAAAKGVVVEEEVVVVVAIVARPYLYQQ